jgi:hypothetical protein
MPMRGSAAFNSSQHGAPRAQPRPGAAAAGPSGGAASKKAAAAAAAAAQKPIADDEEELADAAETYENFANVSTNDLETFGLVSLAGRRAAAVSTLRRAVRDLAVLRVLWPPRSRLR